MTSDNKATVKAFIDRLFADSDVSVLDELAVPHYVDVPAVRRDRNHRRLAVDGDHGSRRVR